MAARRSDARIGHSATTVNDYGDELARSPRQRYVNRWRLERKEAGSGPSEPVRPIVFWLDRNIRHADIQRTATMDETLADFRDRRLEALAGLRMRLVGDAAALPGSRLLEGRFMAVQQAIGVPRREDELTEEAVAWLGRFVAAATASGFVAERIRHHGVNGLSVA